LVVLLIQEADLGSKDLGSKDLDSKDLGSKDSEQDRCMVLEAIPVTVELEVTRVLEHPALGLGVFLLTLEVFTANSLVSTVNTANKIHTVNTASTINRVFTVRVL
jgi:hypothetical protein